MTPRARAARIPWRVELVGELVEDASARLGHGKEPFERERLHPGKVGAGGEHAARGGAVAAQGGPRQGVVRHAEVSASGALGAFTDRRRAPAGDARGSSQNNLAAGFLGDYNYALATNDFGVATWNDVRAAADCPAIDAYRQALYNFLTATSTTQPTAPAPNNVCPATFGNTDIFGGSYADPTLP